MELNAHSKKVQYQNIRIRIKEKNNNNYYYYYYYYGKFRLRTGHEGPEGE